MPALQRTPPQRAGKSPAKPYDRPAEPAADTPEKVASPARTPAKAAHARNLAGSTNAPATPRAFLPRVQKVMRTPPDGASPMPPPPVPAQTLASPRPAPVPVAETISAEVQHDTDMFVEEQIAAGTSTAPRKSMYPALEPTVGSSAPQHISTTPTISPQPKSTTPKISPQPRKSTTPLHPPPAALITPAPFPAEAGPSSQPLAPIASEPRTPRTRRSVAAQPMVDPVPTIEVDEAGQWGKRYELTLSALNTAINKAVSKRSASNTKGVDLKQIFPLLAAKFPKELDQVLEDACSSMKRKIEMSSILRIVSRNPADQGSPKPKSCSSTIELGDHYRCSMRWSRRVKSMQRAVRKYGRTRGDLSPEALTAAANLGIYDEAYERLRTEYLALHQDCSTRFSSIQAKQGQLAELETSITESVAELDETLQVLDGFPTGDMKDWAETTMGRMEGGRVVEKA